MDTARTATLVMLLLAMAAGASASDTPSECTTNDGSWTIFASDPYAAACNGGDCTGISYTILRNSGESPDHVALLVQHDADVIVPGSKDVSAPCAGDNVTSLGSRDCSSQAVRINENSETATFELVLRGEQIPVTSSIAVKKGRTIEQCRITSLGTRNFFFDPDAQVTASQTYDFKGCVVTIPTDVEDGEGGEATLEGEGCAFVANGLPTGIAKLIVDGKDVGFLTQGTGYVSSGTDSCTTRVINRRIYSWCTCEDADGDGFPDDPQPPC